MSTETTNGSKAATMSPDSIGKPKELAPVNDLRRYMDQMKSQIAVALPKHMNADRVSRLVLTEFSKSPKLQLCNIKSIVAGVMTASQLGLEIGVGGQAFLIPYGKTATLVPGWKGLIDLNARAGRSSVWTGAVFEGDTFRWALGDSPFIKHQPCGENDPAKLQFAYAVGRINGAEWPIIECWPNARILKHRDKYNKVGKDHYSYTNWEMYARKVVLLQVLKYLPKSIELQAAVDIAEREEEGRNLILDAEFITIEPDSLPEPEEEK
ncbi:MAG: recombinase RecT [Pirellulales bacterium]